MLSFFFFFQAEDGIRDYKVTGVQTCALPICLPSHSPLSSGSVSLMSSENVSITQTATSPRTLTRELGVFEIGRASCRERGERTEVGKLIRRKKMKNV